VWQSRSRKEPLNYFGGDGAGAVTRYCSGSRPALCFFIDTGTFLKMSHNVTVPYNPDSHLHQFKSQKSEKE
jgi:hypothetical protein